MTALLPDVPLDDETLDLLATCYEPDGPKLTGVLDLLANPDTREHGTRALYSKDALIGDLITEIRRLRAITPEGAA